MHHSDVNIPKQPKQRCLGSLSKPRRHGQRQSNQTKGLKSKTIFPTTIDGSKPTYDR